MTYGREEQATLTNISLQKCYSRGDYKESHLHKIATEYTVIISGRVRMNGVEYSKEYIIVMESGESTDFECLEEGTVNVVVKLLEGKNDK